MEVDEYRHVVAYFHDASDSDLERMGVERGLMPSRESWLAHLHADHGKPAAEADRLWLCWLVDSQPVGHSSLNEMEPGHQAQIHLHLWYPSERCRGLGTRLFQLSIAYAFEHLDLARLYCEPRATNPAPNRTLVKLGFELVKTRWTTPGKITFEQQTNLYVLERHRLAAATTLR